MADLNERVARALCVADGGNPDTVMTPYRVPPIGPKGYIEAAPQDRTFPAWQLYSGQAAAAITLVKAEIAANG